MPDTLPAMSAPPAPPSDYRGLHIALITSDGRRVAQLYAAEGEVVIKVGGQRYIARTSHEIDTLLRSRVDYSQVQPITSERPWAIHREHAVLLLYIANHWPEIHQSDRSRYHLTLSYALPLAIDPAWRLWAEEQTDLLLAAQQLVAVPATDLVAVQPSADTRRRHRRLLRNHTDTVMHEHHDVTAYLDDWCQFSLTRYQRTVPQPERDALHAVLSMSSCVVRDFLHDGDLIGRSIMCRHTPSNTWFDLMATWTPNVARLRPGIYSGVHNLLSAHGNGSRFSLCYGQFPYKDDIVGQSKRLTIHDLQSPVGPTS